MGAGGNIPHNAQMDDFLAFLCQQSFDYLFSIVNEHLLPAEILELPRKCAINYHDAPLPRYAGSHATSWALMDREASHGVTWHVMSKRVDSGDILKQWPVDIVAGDTALTLNAKCYEAAISSFTELIDDLSRGAASGKKQNLDERTFFPLYKRPPVGGVFSWNRCAYETDALVRALDFGPYPNPLGLPKFAIEKDFIIVCKTEVFDSVSETTPGTVMRIDSDSLQVSTTSREITACKFLTIDGQSLSISDLVARFGLHEGSRFKDIDPESARRITELNASICRHEAFWVERLSTLQPVGLPYAVRNVSPPQSARYASVPVPIPIEVTSYLVGCQTDWNLSDFLLAAFAVYLARIGDVWSFDIRYRGAEMRRDLAGLEGFFASELPLRLEMDNSKGFGAAFRAVREQVELTTRHKTYARDALARYPALRSMIELQKACTLSVTVESVARLDNYEATSGGQFTLVIPEDGTECRWVYDTGVLNTDSVTRMLSQFIILLQGIVANPEQRLSVLPILTEAEHRQILVDWNDTRRDYPTYKCIHELVEAQVERNPDTIAVIFEDRQMTYRQLNEIANEVGFLLVKRGLRRGSYVPILMDRNIDVVIAMLAAMKAGAAFVPMDIKWPVERIKQVLEDLSSEVILVNKATPFEETELGRSFLSVDQQAASESAPNLNITLDSRQPIYAIYTSGSTGTPKAVVVPHQGITNRFLWMNEFFGSETAAAVLQTTPHIYDSAVWQLFWPLINGGKTVIPSPGMEIDANYLSNLIARQAVTMTDFVPSVFNTIVPQLVTDDGMRRKLNSLRCIIVGGEEIRPGATYIFMEHFPRVRVVNLYGPTEASIGCVCYEVTGREGGKIPIGKPISNVHVLILDRNMNPVPVGVAGELYLSGICLGLGYLHDEEKTKAVFVDNRFAEIHYAKMYKTGDLARYLPDGNIEFLGRNDHQVKIRGFRIELGEIESVLCQQPAVREAMAMAREDVPGEKRLVAYVVPSRERAPTISELRSFLKSKLPEYMVPSAFVMLDALPLTPNGKVDRRALPVPDHGYPELERNLVAPSTPVEEELAQIWSKVLSLEQVGIHDNFFDLGGHSLSATQVISLVRQAFHLDLPLLSLFEAPTVAGLAAMLLLKQHWQMEQQSLVNLVSQLESLSNEEARRLLCLPEKPQSG